MTAYQRWGAALRYLDLASQGHPSFSKFVCLTILVASIWQDNLTLGVVVALVAASFGRSVFIAFLNRSTVVAAETENRERREISERRDVTAGIEPAP